METLLFTAALLVFAFVATAVGEHVASSTHTITCHCGALVARDVIINQPTGFSRCGSDFVLGSSLLERWSDKLSQQCEVCRDRRKNLQSSTCNLQPFPQSGAPNP